MPRRPFSTGIVFLVVGLLILIVHFAIFIPTSREPNGNIISKTFVDIGNKIGYDSTGYALLFLGALTVILYEVIGVPLSDALRDALNEVAGAVRSRLDDLSKTVSDAAINITSSDIFSVEKLKSQVKNILISGNFSSEELYNIREAVDKQLLGVKDSSGLVYYKFIQEKCIDQSTEPDGFWLDTYRGTLTITHTENGFDWEADGSYYLVMPSTHCKPRIGPIRGIGVSKERALDILERCDFKIYDGDKILFDFKAELGMIKNRDQIFGLGGLRLSGQKKVEYRDGRLRLALEDTYVLRGERPFVRFFERSVLDNTARYHVHSSERPLHDAEYTLKLRPSRSMCITDIRFGATLYYKRDDIVFTPKDAIGGDHVTIGTTEWLVPGIIFVAAWDVCDNMNEGKRPQGESMQKSGAVG